MTDVEVSCSQCGRTLPHHDLGCARGGDATPMSPWDVIDLFHYATKNTDPLDVGCDTCLVPPGSRCVKSTTREETAPHAQRRGSAWERQAAITLALYAHENFKIVEPAD